MALERQAAAEAVRAKLARWRLAKQKVEEAEPKQAQEKKATPRLKESKGWSVEKNRLGEIKRRARAYQIFANNHELRLQQNRGQQKTEPRKTKKWAKPQSYQRKSALQSIRTRDQLK